MRCGDARRALSELLDDEISAARAATVREHLTTCDACTSYDRGLHALRAGLRIAPVEHVVDLVPRVRAELEQRRPERRVRVLSLVAAFTAAFVFGAASVGFLEGPEPVGARDLSDDVLRVQRAIETLQADLTIVEHGWHPDVPERRFVGTVDYRAPESFALQLRDRTPYPSDEWVHDDVDIVVDGATSWERAVIPCPPDALPGCTPREPRTRALLGREPFPDAAPAPLDLVVPVRSFARSDSVQDLGEDELAGRSVIGVRVTVAQIEPLLAGLRSRGNARALHPTDVVDLWLDRDALVPVALDVRAASTEERAEWAARRGFDDGDQVILSVRWDNIRIDDGAGADAFPAPPAGAIERDAGFVTGAVDVTPTWLPPGMQPVREGVVQVAGGPEVAVAAWSDGRAWVKVVETAAWPGGYLLGDLGPVVRKITVGAGVGYVDEKGERVAVHADGYDAVVIGSIATEDLVHIAASLDHRGDEVPGDWNEAASITVDQLEGEEYLLPVGQGDPAARRSGDTVTLAYAGAGERGFLVVEAPGTQLGPPFDPDGRAVDVRGEVGRWSPDLGTLEWVDHGRLVSISSDTLGLGELVAIAEGMVAS